MKLIAYAVLVITTFTLVRLTILKGFNSAKKDNKKVYGNTHTKY
jgi:hypothetical protein